MLFVSPQSYREMLNKIAWGLFWAVLIEIFILSQFNPDIANLLKNNSFGIIYEKVGIKIYIAYFYIPILFAIIENIIKLHDKISDVFKIRYNFDKDIIITLFFKNLNLMLLYEKINSGNRDKIMTDIFYRYAGYGNPVIDRHLIDMALGTWCWYWIILDSTFVTIIFASVSICFGFAVNILIDYFLIILIMFFVMDYIKKDAKKYAIEEVNAILSDSDREKIIKDYLINALHN